MAQGNGESDEVEITPRMMQAGVDAYWALCLDLESETYERIVGDVYRAMTRARTQERFAASEFPRSTLQAHQRFS